VDVFFALFSLQINHGFVEYLWNLVTLPRLMLRPPPQSWVSHVQLKAAQFHGESLYRVSLDLHAAEGGRCSIGSLHLLSVFWPFAVEAEGEQRFPCLPISLKSQSWWTTSCTLISKSGQSGPLKLLGLLRRLQSGPLKMFGLLRRLANTGGLGRSCLDSCACT
jgi:hypothetical protein